MSYNHLQGCVPSMPSESTLATQEDFVKYEERRKRDEKRDVKRALDLFYRFSDKLKELHPSCVGLIHNMIQQRGI